MLCNTSKVAAAACAAIQINSVSFVWRASHCTVLLSTIVLFIFGTSAQAANGISCESAYANPSTLWPPNHKYKQINIRGISGNNVDVQVNCIKQDEPLDAEGDGSTAIDANGIGNSSANVRSERQGGGNGRVYHIGFSASIPNGESCQGVVLVGVPHSKKATPVDDGPVYDSTSLNADCAVFEAPNQPPVANAAAVNTNEDIAVSVLLSGTDPEGEALSYTIVDQPGSGALSGDLPNTLYTPDADYSGSDSFTFFVSDGVLDSVPETVSIVVAPINDIPVASEVSVTTLENTAIATTLVGNDVDGDALSFEVVALPGSGQLSGTAPNLIYTPDENISGSDVFSYRVFDGQAYSDTVNVSIEVTDVNVPPVAQAQSVSTPFNASLSITLSGSDADGDNLTYTIVDSPENGTVSGDAPNIVYTPFSGFAGTNSIGFTVNDGVLTSQIATVSIIVEPQSNRVPVADAGLDSMVAAGEIASMDGSASLDPDGDTLTFQWALVDAPAGADALITNANNVVASYSSEIPGKYTFTLIVNDGELDSVSDTVVVNVQQPNNAPIAVAGDLQNIVLGESATLDGSNSSDANGDALTYRWEIVDAPPGGQAGFTDSTAVNPTFFGNESGEYTVALTVNDGIVDSGASFVVVIVTEQQNNLAPTARASWTIRFDEDFESGRYVELSAAGSSDPDGDDLQYFWRIVDQDPNDSSQLQRATRENARLLREGFDENSYFEQTFELIVSDGVEDSAPVLVTVPQIIEDSPFVFFDDGEQSVGVGESVDLFVEVFGQSSSSASVSWTLLSSPSTSQAIFTPADAVNTSITLDRAGTYSLELVVNFGAPGNEAIFFKTLRAINTTNQPPEAVIVTDETVIVDDSPVVVSVDGSSSTDPDGDTLSYSWEIEPTPGSSAFLSSPTSATTSFVADTRGLYFVELTVDDGQETSTEDFLIFAQGSQPNNNPIADAGPDLMGVAGEAITVSGANSSDPDEDVLEYFWYIQSAPPGSAASLTGEENIDAVFTPDVEGEYTLNLEVYDWDGFSQDSVMVTVSAGNVPPVAIANIGAGQSENPVLGEPYALDGLQSYDPDGGSLFFFWMILNSPEGSSPVLLDSASATPSLTMDAVGDYTLLLTVSDGSAERSNSIQLSAYAVNNQSPIAVIAGPDTAAVDEFTYLDGSGAYDPDGDPIRVRGWGVVLQPPSSQVSFGVRNRDEFGFSGNKQGLYIIGYKVSDGLLESETALHYITLTGDNTPPVANAGSDRTAIVGDTIALNGTLSSDPDSDSLGYSWKIISQPEGSIATLSNPVSSTPTIEPDVNGSYVIELTISDGVDSSADQMVISVAENLPPIANLTISPSGTLFLGTTITLDASGSSDPEGENLEYSWSVESAPVGSSITGSNFNGLATEAITPNVAGAYSISLVVFDGFGYSDSVSVSIDVRDVLDNAAPISVPGYDMSVLTETNWPLFGGFSYDADGDSLNYKWQLSAMPAGSNSEIVDDDGMVASVLFDIPGTYVVELTVSDGGASGTDSFTVIVIQAPVFSPPDPGIDDRASLYGTDQNLNGARDDLERLIYSYQLPDEQADSLLQFAAAKQNMFEEFIQTGSAEAGFVGVLNALECVSFRFGGDAMANTYTRELAAEFTNTIDRYGRMNDLEGSLSGIMWVGREEDQHVKGCL